MVEVNIDENGLIMDLGDGALLCTNQGLKLECRVSLTEEIKEGIKRRKGEMQF